MRVLMDYRPALHERTGVGEYTHQLIREVAVTNRADSVTAFSSSWKNRVPSAARADLPGATVLDLKIPVKLLNLLWHRAEWPSIERLTGSRYDVVHSFHPLLLPSSHAAQLVTIHDLDFLDHPERTRAEIRRDYPVLTRAHAHRADRIVVPSRYTAREVERRLGVAAERISICPPGLPAWRQPVARPAPGEGHVLFLGTLEPRKNIGVLLDAYRVLAGRCELPRLVLAGLATKASVPWLKLIAEPPLAGLVEHVGYVPAERRQELFEGARFLVQPSLDEGFGLPVLEALSLGVPTIVSDRGALPELVGDAGIVFDPTSATALASALERLLADAALAAACSGKGLLRARQFSWASSARLLHDAFEHAVEDRARRARGEPAS